MAAAKRNKTPEQVAETLGVNRRTVVTWANDGCPHSGGKGKPHLFDEAEVAAWLVRTGRKTTPGRPKSAKAKDLDEARSRKEMALAETYELRLARERREVYDAAEVDRLWANIAQVIRAEFQGLGARVVPIALRHGMPAPEAAQFGIDVDSTAADILSHLSARGIAESEASGDTVLEDPAPAGETDAEPVGDEVPGTDAGGDIGAGPVAE